MCEGDDLFGQIFFCISCYDYCGQTPGWRDFDRAGAIFPEP